MTEKICYCCDLKNDVESEFCIKCGAPLELSQYIEFKKLNKNIPEKLKSLFGNRRIDNINKEIEKFIRFSLTYDDFMHNFVKLISGNFNKNDFNDKYDKFDELNDYKFLDVILQDEDLNNKHQFLLKSKSFLDRFNTGILNPLKDFLNEYDNLINSKYYVTFIQKDNLKEDYKKIFDFVSEIKDEINLEGNLKKFHETYLNLDQNIKNRNKLYVEQELIEHEDFFDDIDGKSLDINQRLAVVTNEQNSQIIAGAGCGKTLTVNAKVRYLIEKKGINPKEILCLSFSNASVNDLKEKLPEDVEITTFHKLGGSILKYNDLPSRPDSDSLDNFIRDYFKTNIINNKKLCQDIFEFFAYYFYSLVKEDDINNIGELYDIEERRDFRTLKDLYGGDKEKRTYDNKIVKSFEELVIANYLFAHQIDYEYEKIYECTNKYYNTQKKYIYNLVFSNVNEITNHSMIDDLLDNLLELCGIKEHIIINDYFPDFYIKENEIYLEHFGVNRNCEALWLDKEDSNKYKKGIEWKREIHKKYGSSLIETYSYYMAENVLLPKLEEKLQNMGVEIKEIDYEYLFSKIIERDDVNKFQNFINLIISFIQLFKGNNYDIDKFKEFKRENYTNNIEFDKKRTSLFLDIVEDIYVAYENHLKENLKIDFNDMINNATQEVENGNLHKNYKYIIVDEYQDTSYTRYCLVKAIQDKTDAKVCVVGDDWQSIYRFTGCDVSLFSKFEDYFKNPEKLTIRTTYRNSQELIDISGRFIKKNPNQINKSLKSKKVSSHKPVKIAYYNKSSDEDKIKTMDYLINLISKESNNIMILGRNNYDINDFIERGLFKRKYKDDSSLIYQKNKDLNINFISVHKSKGLEEDNVILINLENSIAGFPNQIDDDPLMNFVINDSDQFPNGEERRLFYVALTRTKNNIFLLVPETDKSEFVVELETHIDDLEIISRDSNQKEQYDDLNTFMKNKNVYSLKTKLKCPFCKTGDVMLKIIKSKNGKDIFKFLECSHSRCEWEGGPYYSKPELIDEIKICPNCGNILYVADGKYGLYLKCLNGCKTPKLSKQKLEQISKTKNIKIPKKANKNKNIKNSLIKTKLKCPKCEKGNIMLKILPEYSYNIFTCSNDKCDWEGGKTKIKNQDLDKIENCPKCDGVLIVKKSGGRRFLACTNFPKCRFTKSLIEDETVELCPNCGSKLVKRYSNKGPFWGCSNFPKCRFTRDIDDNSSKEKTLPNDNTELCPDCGSKLVKRNGRRGPFWGCSNFPKCRFTKDYFGND